MTRTPTRAAKTRADTISPAQVITNAIIAKLEAGVSPWRKSWSAANAESLTRPLRACGTPYRGINVLWLWAVAEQRGYQSPRWMTYRQAQEVGGQVRKGEHGTMAVFYKSYASTQTDDATGEVSTGQRRVLKAYTVFNVEQIDNLPDQFLTPPAPGVIGDTAHQTEIDAFIEASGARIVHGGNQACYRPALDMINLPHAADFDTYADYGATAAHELAHWTGHPTRLNRDLNNRFGDDKYAAEELVAEFASALIGADLGLPVTHLDSHASYIGHWLKILKADERALLYAAARAEDAAGYLLARAGRIDGAIIASGEAEAEIEPRALAA